MKTGKNNASTKEIRGIKPIIANARNVAMAVFLGFLKYGRFL